jgi:bifunctional DNA-binding transcriptional regulator/antitoxin component of YhaV-PrlF toxin-antitoxin module
VDKNGEFPIVNAILRMDGGRVMLPKEYRDRNKLADRSTLICLETKSGAIVWRPAKSQPELTLIEHLRRFQGVEIPEIHAQCPPRL